VSNTDGCDQQIRSQLDDYHRRVHQNEKAEEHDDDEQPAPKRPAAANAASQFTSQISDLDKILSSLDEQEQQPPTTANDVNSTVHKADGRSVDDASTPLNESFIEEAECADVRTARSQLNDCHDQNNDVEGHDDAEQPAPKRPTADNSTSQFTSQISILDMILTSLDEQAYI
jgi:hypothetical protein